MSSLAVLLTMWDPAAVARSRTARVLEGDRVRRIRIKAVWALKYSRLVRTGLIVVATSSTVILEGCSLRDNV
jgi:hypothetical protein